MEKLNHKNKGGRPTIIESEKKNFKLYCYLNEAENETYLQFKKENVGNNSFHLKNALFHYMGNEKSQVKKLNKEVLKMMSDLNKLSNLLNQVARHLNKGLSLDGVSKIQFLKDQKMIQQNIIEIKKIITI